MKSEKNLKFAAILIGILTLIVPAYAVHNPYDYSTIRIDLLNQDPDPAVPGEYVELRWKVQKLGNEDINDLKFVLEEQYPFYFDGSDTAVRSLGDWGGYAGSDEYFILYYKMRVTDDAIEDTYTLKLRYDHAKVQGEVINEFDIRVGDKDNPVLVLGSVQSSPVKLVPDIDEAELSVEIENIGDGDAENVKLTLELPDGIGSSYSYSYTDNLGTISSGESATATFYLDISKDIESKVHEAGLKIRYKESDEDMYEEKEIPMDISIKDKASFEITEVTTQPDAIKPGESADILIKIRNTGTKEADSVSVRGFKDSTQPFEFDEKSDFIGNIAPGEEGSALLKIGVDEDAAAKDYQLELEVRSIEGDDVLIEEESFKIKIIGKQATDTNMIIGIAIICAILAIGLLFYFRRKKR